mmetsp:Transcript_9481/g.38433  ORF Transcript_9481/g.38433 Transcript_9481/m.38433 type:complete len:340 (+) Transcript_9481:2720-3739(+)
MASASAVDRRSPNPPTKPPPLAEARSRAMSVAASLASGARRASHQSLPPPSWESPPLCSAPTREARSASVSRASCANTPSPRRHRISCASNPGPSFGLNPDSRFACVCRCEGRQREAQTATSSDHADTAWTCAACSSTDALKARAIRTAVCTASLSATFSRPRSASPSNPAPKFPFPAVPRAACDIETRLDASESLAPNARTPITASPRAVTSNTPPASNGLRSESKSSTPSSRCVAAASGFIRHRRAHSRAAASGGVGGGGSVARSSSAAILGRSTEFPPEEIFPYPPNPSPSPRDKMTLVSCAARGGRSSTEAAGNDPGGGAVASSANAAVRMIHER